MGITEIDIFNRSFNTDLPHDDYDTLGGWLAAELCRIPRRGDSINHQGLNITVVGADAKRALWLHIQHDSVDPLAPVGTTASALETSQPPYTLPSLPAVACRTPCPFVRPAHRQSVLSGT